MDIHSITLKNYVTAYQQTLDEVPRTMVPKKRIKNQRSKKLEKKANILKNC